MPEACSSWFLPRVVGISKACEWVYSGRVYPIEEAHAAGLVRSVHAPDELLPAAREKSFSFCAGGQRHYNISDRWALDIGANG